MKEIHFSRHCACFLSFLCFQMDLKGQTISLVAQSNADQRMVYYTSYHIFLLFVLYSQRRTQTLKQLHCNDSLFHPLYSHPSLIPGSLTAHFPFELELKNGGRYCLRPFSILVLTGFENTLSWIQKGWAPAPSFILLGRSRCLDKISTLQEVIC